MKESIYKALVLICTILIISNCEPNKTNNLAMEVLDKIKNEFAPDKRVEIFDIDIKNEGNEVKIIGESTSKEAVKNLISLLQENGFNVKNDISLLPAKNLGDKIYGIVNISVANIRSKPSHPSELATQATFGTIVRVLKKEDGWFLIQTPDKYISWVDDDGIFLVDEKDARLWKHSEKIIVTKPVAYIYDESQDNGKIVSDVVLGSLLRISKESGSYFEIRFPDERTGFIRKENCENFNVWKKNLIPTSDKIINTSQIFMGLPYLWGGTSSKGVDCSGFTKTVYYLNGIILPRDASQQVNIGKLVDTESGFENLEKGDLLFFGRKGTSTKSEKITHVAIYLGNMKYIHSAGRVRINSLDKNEADFNKYRYDSFIRAKRILGSFDRGESLVKNNVFYN